MSSVEAVLLDDSYDLSELDGKRVGYYIGSFDPIHLGHEHVIEAALKEGHVDVVLIYPVPGGDSFKNRTDWPIRKQMIASVYHNHPEVLWTDWTPKELQDRWGERVVVGIIGSDVVTQELMSDDPEKREKYQKVFMRGIPLEEKHYDDTVGALTALCAESFVVALRGEVDLSYLKGGIGDREIVSFIQSSGDSSTAVRKAIAEGKPFEHLVSFPVALIIKELGLYGYEKE